MLEPIISLTEELSESFRFVDAIDILLVSLFLYAALVWFRQAASRAMLIGLASLAGVYFLARGLDMYLTSLAFHTSFAVLLFVLVIVFQEDLRRLLERVSTLGSVKFRQALGVPLDLDCLVESVFQMAGAKTGALIVMKGKEPLERHLNGGVSLNGQLSKSLLLSIFDSHTPGHDGAVVIERDRITQFASHLPISKNTKAISGRGTRHSAALGLSEQSDALTIVVSEERGIVSIAEAGRLVEMATASDLKKRLVKYLHKIFPTTSQPAWQRFLVQHGQLKILSLVIAIAAWVVFAHDPSSVQRTFVAPVEYRNLPKEVELDATAPSEARITLTGSERDFRFLDPGSLKVSLDLADAKVGYQEVALATRNLRLPSNVEVYRIEPRVMRLFVRSRSLASESTRANGNGERNVQQD